ncbi:MAG: DUF2283 domain-containing protein [Bacteroidota bacterium]|nr:DUF2283 domain-containing protein [Bacteroidota bacterium]MDP4231367.1 DUF2283 domain-containing protein [Bacteroidota bacterium]MDP4235323.1 DUF2283 domain-containing protein [Bacteroidota bacterium]
MKLKYFNDTDTLLLELADTEVTETRDLNEDTIIDLDKSGNIVSITIEHARKKADINDFTYEQVYALT